MRPTQQKDETTWNLPEVLATGTVRGTDHAFSKRGNHANQQNRMQFGYWEEDLQGSLFYY